MKTNYKLLLYFLLLFQLFTNCEENQNTNKLFFETIDSGQKENKVDSFSNDMYTHYLIDLGERSIHDMEESDKEIYRLTYIPHYSTKNYVYTIWSEQNKCFGRSSTAEYDLTKDTLIDIQSQTKIVNSKWIDELNEMITENELWNLETHVDDSGVDGSDWILELKNNTGYKLVIRWSLERIGVHPKVYEICQKIKGIVTE